MRKHAAGVSPVIATIIIVTVTVAIAIAAAAWLIGLWNTQSNQEMYFHYILQLETPNDTAYQPIPGIAKIEVWSEPSGGGYTVYVRITALRDLAYIQAEAHITNRTGSPPIYVGAQYSDLKWTATSIPAGYYTGQYWSPIADQDYPIRIDLKLFIKEP